MKWMNRLYVGVKAAEQRDKIIDCICQGQIQMDAYVLMLATNPENQLDILSANYLLQPYYRGQEDLTIVGIAKGKDEAFLVLQVIVEEAMKTLGTPDLKKFLAMRMQEDMDA